jgi:hypothetical protein
MFNSLKYAKILEEAGFTQREAETTVNVLIEVMENKLATQEDLKELKHEMKNMELRLTIKLGGMLAASIAIMTAMVKLI